ncbi:MAG: ATP-binding protein [Clostridia bacterium]|nr:ATP-binding protein [Clostridia bacterium]
MLIGREKETAFLEEVVNQEDSQFIAVYGRRRVGKTYLIRETLKGRFTFQHSGVFEGSRIEQLQAFSSALTDAGMAPDHPVPENWFDAFQLLKQLILQSSHQKKILFLDELSWMDTQKSELIRALEHFWNSWCSARNDIILIVCSSATSWILKKVIHNKGGLYHRLTGRLRLMPFTLAQCKTYVEKKNLAFSDTQIMELYMALGGVPFYWELMQKGLSVSQNIDNLFFAAEAPLKDEYDYLFASIFKKPADYLKIIHALAEHKMGLTRAEILSATGLSGSGKFSEKLDELESCGFIREYHAFGKKTKGSLYQLIDPFVRFYHSFLLTRPEDPAFWTHQINTPKLNTWQGLAFELVCLLHIEQIKSRLGISGVLTDVCSFVCGKDPEKGIHGSQIDLVIWRSDHTINLLEMKYKSGPYAITQSYNEELRRKANDFVTETKTRNAIHWTMVTPFGLYWNKYAGEIQSQITSDDLMKF